MADALGFKPDVDVRVKRYKIGCIGAGMIMAEVHLAAYKEAGFQVAAIASRTPANAKTVAERYGIATVHATPEKLIEDKQGCDPTHGATGQPRRRAKPVPRSR